MCPIKIEQHQKNLPDSNLMLLNRYFKVRNKPQNTQSFQKEIVHSET